MDIALKSIWDFITEIRAYYEHKLVDARYNNLLGINKYSDEQIEELQSVIPKIENLRKQFSEINSNYENWKSKKECFSFFGELREQKLETLRKQKLLLLQELKGINVLHELEVVINRRIEELSNSEFLVEGDREEFLRFYREVLIKYNKAEYL